MFPESKGFWERQKVNLDDTLILKNANNNISANGEAAIIVGNAEMADFERVAEWE